MKPIEKDEMYQHVSAFLQAKGVELKEGSYTQKIQKSCALLAETINLGQRGLTTAKQQLGRRLDQVRQVIHEKTAPKPAAEPSPAAKPPTDAAPVTAPAPASPAPRPAKAKAAKKKAKQPGTKAP